jgi:Transmembrane amino acid transporter protein
MELCGRFQCIVAASDQMRPDAALAHCLDNSSNSPTVLVDIRTVLAHNKKQTMSDQHSPVTSDIQRVLASSDSGITPCVLDNMHHSSSSSSSSSAPGPGPGDDNHSAAITHVLTATPRGVRQDALPAELYGSFAAYCFSVNYVLGVGVLGIPWGFVQGGWLLSTIVLALVSLLALVCVHWLPEVMARAEGIRNERALMLVGPNLHSHNHGSSDVTDNLLEAQHTPHDAVQQIRQFIRSRPSTADGSTHSPGPAGYQTGSHSGADVYPQSSKERIEDQGVGTITQEHKELLPSEESLLNSSAAKAAIERNQLSHTHKLEIAELCEIFMNKYHRIIYEVSVSIYFYGALWSYAAVFSNSLASHVPLPFINDGNECNVNDDHSWGCRSLYLFYMLIFSCFAVPLTCLELTEQKLVQIALAIFRFVAMAVIIATSWAAIFSYPNLDLPHTGDSDSAPFWSDVSAVDFSGLPKLFPIAIYSQIFHHSVPGLTQPVRDKSKLHSIFGGVLATTFSFYTMVGISVALYYGSSTDSTCSLNWAGYSGSSTTSTPGWAVFISYLVVLFPPLDIMSAFPLNGMTLGNNLFKKFVTDPVKSRKRKYVIPFRVIAAVPPIIGACFISDLSVLLDYTGTLGIIIAFVYPALLQMSSIKLSKQLFGPQGHQTMYTHKWWSRPIVAQVTFATAMTGFFVVILFTILD